ncbi:LytTR family DNA-binding domain-containing protein [Dyadobacter sp. CY312]|uniref:LytR/AlgR family response regulator transcription factor n=1 Tax=Dyadobacter sp. CY312 TaxID=2907303 RepID=UPI001F1D623B|nr:LytTR family DNA-binding domain-containing protein [Dyadobacter sp. CY312]MCE7044466.1 LytTR family DNA-binding domain-containing protein [Dyadobacter sp. CY312]
MSEKPAPALRCLIIDDEPDSHKLLEYNIGQVSWLSLIGNAYNGLDALAMITSMKPDLIFLDVNMPSISGLQMLEMLPDTKVQVILTTAYSRYALDGYDFSITDFLLKPAYLDRFIKAVTKALTIHQRSYNTQIPLPPITTFSPALQSDFDQSEFKDLPSPLFGESQVTLRVEKKLHRIPYQNIIFLEGLKNYVNVHTYHDCLTTRSSLTDFENRLPEKLFLRTHKSYIINRNCALEIEGNEILLEKEFKVMISKTDRYQILKSLSK